MERLVRDVLDTVIYNDLEPHFSLVWKDVAAELLEVCSILDIPGMTL